MYRPADWGNPYKPELQKDGRWSNAGFSENFDCYEAGADAMLEALRGNGTSITANDPIYMCGIDETDTYPYPGKMVFIPDEV